MVVLQSTITLTPSHLVATVGAASGFLSRDIPGRERHVSPSGTSSDRSQQPDLTLDDAHNLRKRLTQVCECGKFLANAIASGLQG